MSFVVTKHPRKLVKHLRAVRGLRVEPVSDGMYYVVGDVLPVQILERGRLPEDENPFLWSMRGGTAINFQTYFTIDIHATIKSWIN